MTVLEIMGATSLIAVVSLYVAFIGFLPEIVIEGTVDKTENFNSESKILIRNNGRLPARHIRADIYKLNIKIGGIQFHDAQFTNCGPPLAGKLSSGEQTEITIRPGVGVGQGQQFDEYDYELELKYKAKLLFYEKSLSKKWHVKLNNYPDGFSWDTSIV